MKTLTARQTEILEFIKQIIDKTGLPPTRAEMAKLLGFKSVNAAEDHLKALARKGAIEILPGTSRGIRLLTDDFSENLGLPLIGSVAAGEPILAEQNIEAHYAVEPTIFKPIANFLLRVKGDSMKNIGILENDLLAVHSTSRVENGQVVVARIDEDVTVKRFYKNGHKVSLVAENDSFSPIEVDLRHQVFAIEGLAVGVIRSGNW